MLFQTSLEFIVNLGTPKNIKPITIRHSLPLNTITFFSSSMTYVVDFLPRELLCLHVPGANLVRNARLSCICRTMHCKPQNAQSNERQAHLDMLLLVSEERSLFSSILCASKPSCTRATTATRAPQPAPKLQAYAPLCLILPHREVSGLRDCLRLTQGVQGSSIWL